MQRFTLPSFFSGVYFLLVVFLFGFLHFQYLLLGNFLQIIFCTVFDVVIECSLFFFHSLFYLEQSSSTSLSWQVESVHITLRMQSMVGCHKFPGLAIKILRLRLCPVHYSSGVSNDRNCPAVYDSDGISAIEL